MLSTRRNRTSLNLSIRSSGWIETGAKLSEVYLADDALNDYQPEIPQYVTQTVY